MKGGQTLTVEEKLVEALEKAKKLESDLETIKNLKAELETKVNSKNEEIKKLQESNMALLMKIPIVQESFENKDKEDHEESKTMTIDDLLTSQNYKLF